MPTLTKVPFAGGAVGLIVRGKTSHAHSPGVLEQHADCILADGSPIGFFGEGDAASGSSGLGLDGAVYDFEEFQQKRPFYVNGASARGLKIVSAVLRITASSTQAARFRTFWTRLDADPDTFNILGGNCSTRASSAFVHAGLLGGGIPGIDTPDNLWRQLCTIHRGRVTAAYGYIDFQPKGEGFDVYVTGVTP